MIEIRDKGTTIPAIAVRVDPDAFNSVRVERALLSRAGYAEDEAYVFLLDITPPLKVWYSSNQFYGQLYSRTYPIVMRYLEDNWNAVDNYSVVDVEFILGETYKPKQAECV